MEDKKLKLKIAAAVDDLVGKLLYYDRKEDEDLPQGEIERAVKEGIITWNEIKAMFCASLDMAIKNNNL